MADGVKISLLPGAGTPTDADVVVGVQAGSTKKFSFAAIFAWLKAKLTPGEIGAQGKILVSGLLKGDGVGGISAAQAGTDYATPSQIPAVPSASTANPQMDGTESPGSTGQWSDGGHIHPTDTTRAAAALEINGHPLTGDFDLTAADVGALASSGTAVAAEKLVHAHRISGNAGWYRFLKMTLDNNATSVMNLWITEAYLAGGVPNSALLRIYFNKASNGNPTASIRLLASTYDSKNIRFAIVDTYLEVYINKSSSNTGAIFFYNLGQTTRTVINGTNYWLSDAISEPTTANDASNYIYNLAWGAERDGNGNNIAESRLWFSTVAVSAGTAQQILSISDAAITADHVLAEISFADPAYITGSGSWASAAGSFTLTGTATAATTADVLLVRKGN